MVLLAACSKDGSGPGPDPVIPIAEQSPRVMVLTVFSPSQLGDLGYADRVLKGLCALDIGHDDADSVDVEFIATNDAKNTRALMADMLETRNKSINGKPYSRRLLVLTEPFMVDWLAALKHFIQPVDEVLLLKVNEDDVNAAATNLGMEGRVHGLNISAASAVRHFEASRRIFYEMMGYPNDSSYDMGVLRLYSDDLVPRRDSIVEALIEVNHGHHPPEVTNLVNEAGGLYSYHTQTTIFKTAYQACAIVANEYLTDGIPYCFIADLGAAASGAEFYMASHPNQYYMLRLDAEPISLKHRYAITRHFDRALEQWGKRWISQPTAKMPLMELHGDWDGYCTDDCKPEDIFGGSTVSLFTNIYKEVQ